MLTDIERQIDIKFCHEMDQIFLLEKIPDMSFIKKCSKASKEALTGEKMPEEYMSKDIASHISLEKADHAKLEPMQI